MSRVVNYFEVEAQPAVLVDAQVAIVDSHYTEISPASSSTSAWKQVRAREQDQRRCQCERDWLLALPNLAEGFEIFELPALGPGEKSWHRFACSSQRYRPTMGL